VSRSVKLFAVVVILISAVVLLPINVAAAGVLDQQQTTMNGSAGLFSSPPASYSQFSSQTFTAGLTGSLTEVDLAIACYSPTGAPCTSNGDVTVEIHSGSRTGALLGSSSLGPSAFPIIGSIIPSVFVAFTFSSPAVVAGSVYGMVITTANAPGSPPAYVVGKSSLDPYAAGMASFSTVTGWVDATYTDLAFKTYVTSAATPPVGAPVGGFVEPVNKLAVFAPYLALFGVMAVVVVFWKRPDS
jgi:hypothetical protein